MAALQDTNDEELEIEELRENREEVLDDSTFSALLSIVLMVGTLGFVIYFFYL